MKCPRKLRGAPGAVIDTNVLIYLFEDHPTYGEVAEFVVDEAASGVFTGVVTPVTAAELLVKPLESGRTDVADRYRSALSHMRNIRQVGLDFDVGVMAGALRARYRLPLPDMLQVAVAMQYSPAVVITNDKLLAKVEEVRCVWLNEFR